MITFGLTGGIASGKSTVTKTFRAHGIPMVDADIVAREVVEPGTKGLKSIVDVFGAEYLQADGTLDRPKLAKIVFESRDARRKIEEIMSPLINDEANRQIKELHKSHNMVGYDAALICEMGNANKYRPLILVYCAQETQLARLMKRNNLTESEAIARINAQMSTDQKMKLADYTINTDYSIESSIEQTTLLIKRIANEKL